MPLNFPGAWRFRLPASNSSNTTTIPPAALAQFLDLVQRTATQDDLQNPLEFFKSYFCAANGTTNMRSSDPSWAYTDLLAQMENTSTSPPLFLEAFYDACERIRARGGDWSAPDTDMLNDICVEHNIGYELRPPNLVLRDTSARIIPVEERPPSIAEIGLNTLNDSLRRAEELLRQRRGREAVQESLWLLETIATAFRSIDTRTGTIQGRYFNTIIRELRQLAAGTSLERVLEWANSLHGYLSSPTGGGVRHGLDLREGLPLSLNESKLFCNLIRSYISFLLGEYERLETDRE
jgi:hypothetical protein